MHSGLLTLIGVGLHAPAPGLHWVGTHREQLRTPVGFAVFPRLASRVVGRYDAAQELAAAPGPNAPQDR